MTDPAKPIAVQLTLTSGTPSLGHQCDQCGFDSEIRVSLHMISGHGVTTAGTFRHCGRCETTRPVRRG